MAKPDTTESKKAAPKKSKAAAKKETKAPEVTRGKKYLEKVALVEKMRRYSLNEAIELAKQTSYSKFPGSLEIHINTATKNIRGLVTLPHVAGKKLKILAFGRNAETSGADEVGDDAKIANIEKGRIDFDVVVTTPDWMPKLARVARVLGPRGLMPNPKNGTITDNLAKAVEELQAGKTEYKTEPNNQVIHLAIGKVDQSSEEVSANIKALFQSIGKSRIKKVTIAPSMGLGVKVEPSSIG